MKYDMKLGPELGWALLVGAVVALLQLGLDFQPETVTDWTVWAIAAGGAVIRGAAAYGLTKLTELVRGLPE